MTIFSSQDSEGAHLTSSWTGAKIPGLVARVPIQLVLWLKSSLEDIHMHLQMNTFWTCQIRTHVHTSV